MSLYYDSGVLVKLYVREERSDAVARFLAERGEAVVINHLHEIEMRNAVRLKRFREEIDDEQLAASMAMLWSDLAARRLIRTGVDWQSVFAEAERLSATVTAGTGVHTIDSAACRPLHSIRRLPGWCPRTTGNARRPGSRASDSSSLQADSIVSEESRLV